MGKLGVVVFTALCAVGMSGYVCAQDKEETVFSPTTATVFIKTAQELFRQDAAAIEPAMRFLEAADAMDSGSTAIPELRLRIGGQTCLTQVNYSDTLESAMRVYVGRQFDLEVAMGAIRCMLSQLNTRQDREVLLTKLLGQYAPRNAMLGSELAVQLGLLNLEKADRKGAIEKLNYAYALNPYNRLAFDTLQQCYAADGLSVSPEAYCVHLRRMVDVNPYDLSAAMDYASVLRQFELYEAAARMYAYADRLCSYQVSDKSSGADIYLPWMVCCYHTPRMVGECLDLADRFRDPASLNLMLESLAGRAAAKLGRTEQARELLEKAAEKAESMLGQKDLAIPIYPEHLAWFFSFVLERPDNALAWSNQAFSQSPDRRGVKSIFAYTLALNGQYDVAKQYAEALAETDQIAAVTMAMIYRQQDDRQKAIDLLRSAIAMAPDSFEAEKAEAMLTDMGSDYIRPNTAQVIDTALSQAFETAVIPTFLEPSKRFTAKMLFGSSDILYGADIDARLIIENTSASPLVLQDGGLLAGYIRVDATVRGAVSREFANLFSTRIRPGQPIMSNDHILVPLDLRTGPLRTLLASCPQASLDLEFAVYLDPVVEADGTVHNALAGTMPVTASVQRRGVNLTREFMMQRLDALAKGQEGQKIQAGRLFAGLLAEQEAFRRGQFNYAHIRAEPALLTDAVRRAMTDANWRLRVHTMEAVSFLTFPADFALIQALSSNLNHDRWPVRFMAVYLLSSLQGQAFQPVLDWTAQYDANSLNRRFAVALGGKQPPQPQRE